MAQRFETNEHTTNRRIAHSLEPHVDLVRIDQFRRRVHDAAKQAAALAAPTAAAHHARRASHHVDEESDDQQRRQQAGEARRLHFVLVDDGHIVDRFGAQLQLGRLQVALERVDAADVEPQNALRNGWCFISN